MRKVAEDVVASGVQKALEPMAPPDRKVVHDTVNEIAGVHTVSEGEDDRRRVVIIPDDASGRLARRGPTCADHPALLEQLERARTLGFLGPGPVEPHIDHAGGLRRRPGRTSTGTVVDLGSGGGVPGWCSRVARPDLHLVLVDARAKRCRFLEAAVAALGLDAEVVEGRAEVVGRTERAGERATRWWPAASACRRPPPSAAVPCCGSVAGSSSASRRRRRSPTAGRPAGLRRSASRRPCGSVDGHRRAGARAADAVPGRLPPAGRPARQAPPVLSPPCSTWNTPRRRRRTRGREFHVEHRERSLRRGGPPGRMQR